MNTTDRVVIIAQLEEHLGVQLLHRSTRKLSLTEAGERCFSKAVDALAAAQEAEDSVSELQGKPKGYLKTHSTPKKTDDLYNHFGRMWHRAINNIYGQ
ncbi:LysR family transcriptional regulator [Parendozoicomonas sp. Alg238-R29]|uniref:LysR family transcriptional regulator n=1 Tax=Parendozoicomonas sp. Alg238-R29 TaxID=2993446 RepID=UPI00248DB1E5|nr:LysR family transcriptional regulator [Parendozoicomonas sp. Alg238-R29]